MFKKFTMFFQKLSKNKIIKGKIKKKNLRKFKKMLSKLSKN